MKDELFELFANICRPQPLPSMPITAIWLNKPLMTSDGIKSRITEGDYVLVEGNELKDCLDKPTHIITSCHGKVDNTDLHIVCMDIKTMELKRIQLTP